MKLYSSTMQEQVQIFGGKFFISCYLINKAPFHSDGLQWICSYQRRTCARSYSVSTFEIAWINS